jgi:hypothetical protein
MAEILPDPSSAPAVCEVCGVGFVPLNGAKGRYCSPQCHGKGTTAQWLASSDAPQPGSRYGAWTVLSFSHRLAKSRVSYFLCRCDCGFETPVLIQSLRDGRSTRCRHCAAKKRVTHGHCRFHTSTPEYSSWQAMHWRCRNPKYESWDHYGGRGITVCERWHSFENFLADMGHRPGLEYTLDRVDNDGNYEPGNVRWAPVAVQQNNRSTSKYFTFAGQTQTLSQWAGMLGIPTRTLRDRLKKGWSVERTLTEPFHEERSLRQKKGTG